jgi:hypothetical protein
VGGRTARKETLGMSLRSLPSALALIPFLAALPAAAEEEDMSAAGFDNMRIEQEEKLFVPMEIADEVLAFLKARYVDDKAHLAELDPAFTSSYADEDFTDVYYDTPSLQLLATQSGVRHRTRVNLTNPEDRKSGRELMQIKVNQISSNALERGEIKFAIEHLRRPVTPEDTHPMLGIVKKEHRDLFKKRLVDLGLDPQSMRVVLTVRDLRTRVYVMRDGQPFMSVSFDQVRSNLLWAETRFVEIEPELNEIAFTDADPETRRYMESVLARIVAEIRAEFPQIQSNLTPKYCKAFFGLEAQIPMLRRLVATNLHHAESLASLVLVAVATLGFAGFLAWRGIAAARQGRQQRLTRQSA